MAIQMLFISAAFMIFNLPLVIMYLAHFVGLPPDVGVAVQLYYLFSCLLVTIFSAFRLFKFITKLTTKTQEDFS